MKRIALVMALLAVRLAAQAPDPTSGVDHFDISGTVLDAVSAKPVARAQITLQPRESGEARAATSDATGGFTMRGVPAGVYDLAATKTGYTDANAGAHKVVLAGQTQNNRFTLKLQPQAVLSGTVLNEDGEPVVRAEVRLLRPTIAEGHKRLRMLTTAVTDDRGAFRFYGLEAGHYYAAAFAEASPSDQQRRQAYAPTLYPNATDIAGAQALELRPDAEQQISINLSLTEAFRVRGRVTPANANVEVRLRPADGVDESLAPPVEGRYNRADSSFEMSGVPPGNYLVTGAVQEQGKTRIVYRSVTVGGADVADVALDFGPISPLAGIVKVEGDQAAASAVSAIRFSSAGGSSEARVSEKGSFVAAQLAPGHYWISGALTPGWYIRSATQSGIDVLANGIASVGEGFPSQLEITVSPRGAAIEATVTWPDQGPRTPAHVTVLQQHGAEMVAVGEARVSPGAETGARSTLIGGLAPGDYVVYAFPEPVTVEYANPEALRDFESFAQKVTLTEGQRSQVTAPLALNQ